MQDPATSQPGYFTYRPTEPDRVIHLSLDAVDGLLAEIMTGFGAIPRRGAEVGGILLGKTTGNAIWIEAFAMVPCEHRRGPSYLLSDKDQEAFAQVFEQHRNQPNFPIGLFRSNTRDQNEITDEDRALFRKYFPAPAGAFLLVKPFAGKTSVGSFLTYKDGVLPGSNAETFPFMRWELEGGPAPRRRALNDPRPKRDVPEKSERGPAPEGAIAALAIPRPEKTSRAPAPPFLPPDDSDESWGPDRLEEPVEQAEPHAPPRRYGWHWIPLSFMFLALGVLLGFESALTFYPRAAQDGSIYSLGLTATGKDDNLHIQWNREAPAIKSAQRGRLDIQDGKYSKTVDLDPSSLQTGSVVFPPISGNVNLRFQVTVKGGGTVVETLDWARGNPRPTKP